MCLQEVKLVGDHSQVSQNLPLVRHIISCCCPESLEMRIPTFSVHSLSLPLTAPELCFTEPASVPWLALPNRPHLGKSLLSGLRLILSFQTSCTTKPPSSLSPTPKNYFTRQTGYLCTSHTHPIFFTCSTHSFCKWSHLIIRHILIDVKEYFS